MTMGPIFWKLLAAACLLWYSTITVYVAVRGFRDIKTMLKRLKAGGNPASGEE